MRLTLLRCEVNQQENCYYEKVVERKLNMLVSQLNITVGRHARDFNLYIFMAMP